MTQKLHVSHVKISNILGIEELEFAPGGFTEVRGANGSGKSSTIEALRAALRGGHDATLLRNGCDKGEIVLVLDDGSQITKTITAEATKVNVLRGERKLSRAAESIKALHDVLSVNPVEFLRAPEKARVDALLQVMPIRVDQSRIEGMVPSGMVAGGDGLDMIEATKKAVFAERTGLSRTARDKDGAVRQLRATLPENVPDAPDTDASLFDAIAAIDASRDAAFAESEKQAGRSLFALDAEIDDVHGQIRVIEEEARVRVARAVDCINEARRRKAESVSLLDEGKAAVRADHSVARAVIQEKLDGIKAVHEQQARYAMTTESINRMAIEIESLNAEAHGLTTAIEGLDAYKAELLASLPIPGLEVIEGRLQRYGIQFDRLNTAQQVEVAVEIAKLRAGELGLICVDGLELLDHEHYLAFREHAAASGLQLIVSRVSDGALAVTTGKEAARE